MRNCSLLPWQSLGHLLGLILRLLGASWHHDRLAMASVRYQNPETCCRLQASQFHVRVCVQRATLGPPALPRSGRGRCSLRRPLAIASGRAGSRRGAHTTLDVTWRRGKQGGVLACVALGGVPRVGARRLSPTLLECDVARQSTCGWPNQIRVRQGKEWPRIVTFGCAQLGLNRLASSVWYIFLGFM